MGICRRIERLRQYGFNEVNNSFVSVMDEQANVVLPLQRSRVYAPLPVLCLLSSVIGITAWMDPTLMLTLLLLPLLIFRAANRGGVFVVAFLYYAVASHAVPGIILGFFPNLSTLTSVLVWAGDAALLALPWTIAFAPPPATMMRRAMGVIAALLVLSLPPFGFFHWGTPLMVSGLLFPGWGWMGLCVTTIILAMIAVAGKRTHKVHSAIVVVILFTIVANVMYREPVPPKDWLAISLESGRNPELWSDDMAVKREGLAERAMAALSSGAKVIIFPEASTGSSRREQRNTWARVSEQAKARGATVLVGEETWNAGRTGFQNALIGFGTEKDGGDVVVSSMVPMPMGDWKFGFAEGAETNLFGSDVIELHGMKVAFSMCYEDFLLWPHRGLLTGRADLFVSATNQWPSSGTSAETIQDISRAALARMAGVPMLTAKNR